MNITVIKISGSVFYWKKVDGELPRLLKLFERLARRGHRLVLVTGGGETARSYISVARRLGASESILDDLGLKAARMNAELLLGGLGEMAFPTVPESLDEVAKAVLSNKIVVVGGFHPGHSTNAVGALIAERVRANLLVNATDVDGVYTADPQKVKGARKLDQITYHQLITMLQEGCMKAGTYELLDLVAIKIIERSKIRTRIVKCDPVSIEGAINDEQVGTLIVGD